MILKSYFNYNLAIIYLLLISNRHFSLAQSSVYEDNDEEGFSYSEDIDDDLSASQDETFGHLTGDVQNWAAIIQNYILQVNKRMMHLISFKKLMLSHF